MTVTQHLAGFRPFQSMHGCWLYTPTPCQPSAPAHDANQQLTQRSGPAAMHLCGGSNNAADTSVFHHQHQHHQHQHHQQQNQQPMLPHSHMLQDIRRQLQQQQHQAMPAVICSVSEPAAAAARQSAAAASGRPGSADVIGSSSLEHSHSPSSSSSSPSHSSSSSSSRSWSDIVRTAGLKALGGGLPGSAAMVVQVLSLMWLRTTVNFQYRYGTSSLVALRTLYADGGVPRFYRGVGPALLQGPLCRFGDTAANGGVLSLLNELQATAGLPVGVKTAAASATAAAWRMLLLPLDATKTMMQVEGQGGLSHLARKVAHGGPGVLYHGAAASAAATFVGHYPWFTTFNYLDQVLPRPDVTHLKLLRSAAIGFCAGVASDVVSNSVRVVKTTRQTARTAMSYREVVQSVVAADGVSGLFTRGLSTRIAANGLQNICFTVLWQLGQERLGQSGLLAGRPASSSSDGDGIGKPEQEVR